MRSCVIQFSSAVNFCLRGPKWSYLDLDVSQLVQDFRHFFMQSGVHYQLLLKAKAGFSNTGIAQPKVTTDILQRFSAVLMT